MIIKKYKFIYVVYFVFLIFIIYFNYEPKMKFISERFYLMGTQGKIQIFVKDIENGNIAIQNAINRIKNIEHLLTKFSVDSDISKINKHPFIYNEVSFDTIFNLIFAKQISTMTNGYFDIGIGDILAIYKVDNIKPQYKDIIINNFRYKLFNIYNKTSIKLIRKNTMIDLGGIGKGFAIDEAVKIIKNFGINNVAIEFGGDIKVNYNMPSEKPWIIMIDSKLLCFLNSNTIFFKLKNNSMAISGGYLKKAKDINIIKHHIINPKILKSNKYLCVIVVGKKNIICDSLATASYNMNFLSLCSTKITFNNYIIKIFL